MTFDTGSELSFHSYTMDPASPYTWVTLRTELRCGCLQLLTGTQTLSDVAAHAAAEVAEDNLAKFSTTAVSAVILKYCIMCKIGLQCKRRIVQMRNRSNLSVHVQQHKQS